MMRIVVLLAALIPSALVIAWMIRSRYERRHIEAAMERKRLETEIELAEDSIHNVELEDQLLVTQQRLRDKRRRDARRMDDGGIGLIYVDGGASDVNAGTGDGGGGDDGGA